jgi:hypothetical protein
MHWGDDIVDFWGMSSSDVPFLYVLRALAAFVVGDTELTCV